MPRDLPAAFRVFIATALLTAVSITLLASISTLRKPAMVVISYQPASR